MKTWFSGVLIAILLLSNGVHGGEKTATFSVGFTDALFSTLNKADAVASIKVWVDTILIQRGIRLAETPSVYSDLKKMKSELAAGRVDLIAMLSTEFLALESELELEHFHYTSINGSISEEYLLLVRQADGIESLSELRGKRLAFVEGVRLSLSMIWLETMLLEAGCGSPFSYFGQMSGDVKISRAILSVFFGKMDACLVTRGGYEIMKELNPQIGRKLKPILTSPEFVPALFCIRKGVEENLKAEVLAGLHELDASVRGQQILTVFKADALVEGPDDALSLTRAWVARHALLLDQLDAAGPVISEEEK